jgi:type IV pilus assembly protein PilP
MSRLVFGVVMGVVMVVAVGRASAEPPPPAQTALAVEPPADPPYDPTDRRDPFRPPSAGLTRRANGEPPTPLQRFEIGQLRLVAIMYNTREPRAVLEDEQGLGYIVKMGTPVGLNDGKVRTIEKGRVVIEERTVDYYGETQPSEVVLELRTAERGQ